jgi:hypothetical protein
MFASQIYVPPAYKFDVPLSKQKVSLSVEPSMHNKLIKKNVIHFFERGRSKKTGSVADMYDHKHGIRLNLRDDNFISDNG